MTGDDAHAAAVARRNSSTAYKISQRVLRSERVHGGSVTPMSIYCVCAQPDGVSNRNRGWETVVCQRCGYVVRPTPGRGGRS